MPALRDLVTAVLEAADAVQAPPPGVVPIPGGHGKTTFHLVEANAYLQVRSRRPWHEPVVEAHAVWDATACAIAPLLASGSTTTSWWYVFGAVPGRALAVLPESGDTMEGFRRYGREIRRLSIVPARGFGLFCAGLVGSSDSWTEFLRVRAEASLEAWGDGGAERDRVRVSVADLLQACGDLQPDSRVVFVDVSPANALWDAASCSLHVVDYDYLIAGDPAYALARFWALAPSTASYSAFADGFGGERPPSPAWALYRMLHLIELLGSRGFGDAAWEPTKAELLAALATLAAEPLRRADASRTLTPRSRRHPKSSEPLA